MRRTLTIALLWLAAFAAAVPAHADITRIAGPNALLGESRMFVRFDTAFDSTNRVYLMVWGTQLPGPVNGQFISEAGNLIGAPFAISSGSQQSGWARVIYSAAQGKFLVSYTKIKGISQHEKLARFVTYSGGAASLGTEIWLDAWAGEAGNESGLAYSAPSGRFFVTWWRVQGSPASFVATLDASGTVLNTQLLTNTADGQSDPEIDCDPTSRKCLVVGWSWGVFNGGKTALWGRFIDDVNGNPEGSDSFYLPAGGYLEQPTVTFSAAGSRFLVAYTSSGQVFGNLVNGADGQAGSAYPLMVSNSSTAAQDGGGYGFPTIVYNSRSQTSVVAALPWGGIPAVQEIAGDGSPIAGARQFVPNNGGVGRPDPWEYRSKYVIPTANTASNEFLVIDNHLFNLFRLSRFSAGTACSVSLPGSSHSVGSSSASGSLPITASDASCEWSVSSNASWLTFTAPAARTGSSTVDFSIAANNTTNARTAALTIGGHAFTISQGGVPCGYSINPTSHSILSGPADGGTITVTTSLPPGVTGTCPWSAINNTPGLSFQNGSNRSNTGQVTFSVTANYTTNGRVLIGTIAGEQFTLTQGGAGVDAALVARERTRADLNGDGLGDLLWQDTNSGYLATWNLSGTHTSWTAASSSVRVLDNNWQVAGTGDFNGDDKPDIVWRHQITGDLYVWFMDAALNRIGGGPFDFGGEPDTRWKVVGVGDFNGDRKPDLVWQHDTGWLTVYLMDGLHLIGSSDITPGRVLDARWRIAGVGDLNADGNSDLIFQHTASGELAGWIMSGTTRTQYLGFFPSAIVDLNWRLASIVDVNGDQAVDLVWQNSALGTVAVWYMNGTTRIQAFSFPWTVGSNWRIVGPK